MSPMLIPPTGLTPDGERVFGLVTTGVRDCARCGGDHERVTFYPFHHPPKELGVTHYAPCPRTHEPILMRRKDES